MAAEVDAAPERPAEPVSLLDRLLDARDRLIASPRFRQLAGRLPIARGIGRARARALFDLGAGFVYAQVLSACVQLRLFDLLLGQPRSLAEIAHITALPEEGARRLIEAAVALDLLAHRSRGRIGVGPLGAVLAGNPGLTRMIEHHAMLYRDLEDPLALLRRGPGGGELQRYWAYARSPDPAGADADATGSYTELMAASQADVASMVLDAYDITRHRALLDVGGGSGSFLLEAARRAPRSSVTLFDLPSVAARAAARFDAAGLGSRARAIGGDFLEGPLPGGADLVTLVRILHDHEDVSVRRLLRQVRQAIAPGGTLLVAEPMAGTPGAEAMGAGYFGLYLFAMGQGKPRTEAVLRGFLAEAGFGSIRSRPTATPLIARVLVAQVVSQSRVPTVNLA